MTDFEDDFIKIINKPDQYMPEIWHRQIELIKVGTWFFGLLPVYKWQYTRWEKQQ